VKPNLAKFIVATSTASAAGKISLRKYNVMQFKLAFKFNSVASSHLGCKILITAQFYDSEVSAEIRVFSITFSYFRPSVIGVKNF
jgi:hypothetical protein